MGGQVLGGGVVVAVVVLLWAVYLTPTWLGRMRYNAAERNAIRLNQALRVLAESSETPEEVRLELSAREARAQSRLVRRMREEDERIRADEEQRELDRKRLEVDAELARRREEAALEDERLRLERERALEQRRRLARELRLDPDVLRPRRSRARRVVRAGASALTLVGLVLAGVGVWLTVALASPWLLIGGLFLAAVGVQTLRRMAAISRRSVRRVAAVAAEPTPTVVAAPRVVPELINPEDRGWTPRTLPAPLSQVPGSRAAVAQAEADAREALRSAALQEALREQAERQNPAPVSIAEPRPSSAPAASDDAAIEAHVRELLARRAAS